VHLAHHTLFNVLQTVKQQKQKRAAYYCKHRHSNFAACVFTMCGLLLAFKFEKGPRNCGRALSLCCLSPPLTQFARENYMFNGAQFKDDLS